jgi:hypothetical protein
LDFKKYLLNEKTSRVICFIIAVAAVIYMAVHVYASRHTRYVDDFKIYYYTAQAFKTGLNPYPPESINQMAGFDLKTVYRYAPYTLFILRPLAELKYDDALLVFMCLKALMIIAVFYIWQLLFSKEKFGYVFTVFTIIGFNAAIYLDFKFGNISIFEQFFIWLGLYFFTKRKYMVFTVMIILASLFKFWPILLLFIFLTEGTKESFRRLVLSFAAFALLQAALYFTLPGLYISFINSSPIDESGGGHDPSSYKLLLDVFTGAGSGKGLPFYAVYGAWAIICSAIAAFAVSKAGKGKMWEKAFVIMLTYAIIVPRMKDYSFILLLPAAYYFTTKIAGKYWSLLLLVLFSENFVNKFTPYLIGGYYYFYVSVVIWIFGLVVLFHDAGRDSTPVLSG